MALSQSDYKLLDLVDERTKHLVSGFIRKASKNIPLPIIEICILFCFIREYFAAHTAGLLIEGKEKQIIRSTEQQWSKMGYGSNWFESTSKRIVKWTIEIVNNTNITHTIMKNGYGVGITSKEDTLGSHFIGRPIHSPNYFLCNGSIFNDDGLIKSRYLTKEQFGGKGSSITMELNLEKGHLSFYNDKKNFGIAINVKRDESIRYKLAVCLCHKYASMKIIKFESNQL